MKILSALVTAACCLAVASPVLHAADHLDSPSVQVDGSLDITDLFAFQSPQTADNAVIIMGVNPGVGVFSDNTFSKNGTYSINIDNDGDAEADIAYVLKFSKARRNGTQRYAVYRVADRSNARQNRRNNNSKRRHRVRLLAVGKTGQARNLRGGGQVQAGLFEDPFFFDLAGFNNGFAFTGDDFFAGLNITAIVLEIPRSDLGGDNVAVWATTHDGNGQFDRAGRPAISTALIGSGRKDAFNAGVPSDDFAEFGDEMTATITSLNGGDSDTAAAITAILLPDLLTVDFSSTAGFLNGRQPADDVINAELGLLTNGALVTDGVDNNDALFLSSFPYLAAPN